MINCTICLEQLKSPVVIPCGHVHCEKCLTSHIQSGADAIHSQCPTCRTTFNTATPDRRYVPKKYHEFMHSSVRKLYIEIPSSAGFSGQITALEARVQSLENDKRRLMDKCESHSSAITAHSTGEKKARIEAENLRKEMGDLKKKYEAVRGKYRDLKSSKNTDDSVISEPVAAILNLPINSSSAFVGPVSNRSARFSPFVRPSRSKASGASGSILGAILPVDPPPIFRRSLQTRPGPDNLHLNSLSSNSPLQQSPHRSTSHVTYSWMLEDDLMEMGGDELIYDSDQAITNE